MSSRPPARHARGGARNPAIIEQRDRSVQPGDHLGPYKILGEVGQGGMGVIYKAHDPSLDRIVALKVLRDDLRAQKSLVARFRREAQAAALLNHPNIVQIYAVGELDGHPFIAMEFIDGVPLSAIMQREGQIPWRRSLRIVRQVADALTCAHEAQVIHRDIKPPNILVDEHDTAFVTDFGIAKILTVEEQLTVDGTRLGTPQYMSPERCQDGEVVAQSDIYSLGVLLFQMLTGRLPFEASSSVELVRKILSEPPARVRRYAPQVPPNVERLVAYLIEKRPEDRPHDAEHVMDAIDTVMTGGNLDAEHLSVQSALADFRRYDTGEAGAALDETTAALLPEDPVARLTMRWFGTVHVKRVAAVASVFVVIGLALGVLLARTLREDPAVAMQRELQADIERWQMSGDLATFTDETSRVALARLHLSEFRAVQAAPGWSAIHVLFAGVDTTSREGQHWVARVLPDQRSAGIAIEPVARGGLRLVAASHHGTGSGPFDGLMVARFRPPPGAGLPRDDLLAVAPDDGPTAVTPLFEAAEDEELRSGRVMAMDLHPAGDRIAVALAGAGERSSYLAEVSRESATAWDRAVLTDTGRPIRRVEYMPGGDRILYVRETDDPELQLFVASRGQPVREATPLLARRFDPESLGVSPDARWLVLTEQLRPGMDTVLLAPLDAPGEVVDLGDGRAPAWGGDGRFVLALDEDRYGAEQVFAVEVAEPHRRAQLTYLEPGVRPPLAVTGDGRWAMAPMRGSAPVLALVKLDDVTFR